MKPCWRPCAVKTSPIAEIPSVTSQNPQFPTRKLQSGASFISKRASAGGTPAPRRPAARTAASRGQTYIVPAIAHTTNVPKTVRCECEMTKSVKCVGCWSERSASSEPWKQPTRYMSEPTIKNFAGRFRENSCQRPIMVPKKFCSTVHTEMISIIDETIALVSPQSAIGEYRSGWIPTDGEKSASDRNASSEHG